MSSPLEDEAASSRGKGSRKGLLPGHDADAGGGGGGGGTDVAGKEMGEVQADWRVGGGAGNRVTKKAATPPRGCPVSVPWDQLPRDPGKKRAAVFTPYNIVSCWRADCGWLAAWQGPWGSCRWLQLAPSLRGRAVVCASNTHSECGAPTRPGHSHPAAGVWRRRALPAVGGGGAPGSGTRPAARQPRSLHAAARPQPAGHSSAGLLRWCVCPSSAPTTCCARLPPPPPRVRAASCTGTRTAHVYRRT